MKTFEENHSKETIKKKSSTLRLFNLAAGAYMLNEHFNAGAFYGKALIEYFDSGIWNSHDPILIPIEQKRKTDCGETPNTCLPKE